MIYLYSGTPGSGKSLHCAMTITNWARLGYPVICNFECNLEKYKRSKFTYISNDELTPERLKKISADHFKGKRVKEGSLLLVIDECQLMFNSREWQKAGRANWLEFFTQHRKYGYDIILIAQFDRMIDRQIRSLIEYEYIHRKMGNFGFQGKILSLVMGGNSIVCVKRWYPLNEKIGVEILHVRKRLFKIYDSYNTFSETAATQPEGKGQGVPLIPAAEPDVPEVICAE